MACGLEGQLKDQNQVVVVAMEEGLKSLPIPEDLKGS